MIGIHMEMPWYVYTPNSHLYIAVYIITYNSTFIMQQIFDIIKKGMWYKFTHLDVT